ncbi:PLP-dependent aminotransferase family protein [Bacillus sp. 31A1R]|uniref:PLP-dependent aminotransferase family protein n=1 Tax=Robertmurraya mangrovi TaxID=3098077 RepID=A0ABU5IVV3_9BACI|nr:PLP-dependent aminotransferase family protein [Bacillus sp. 31A1R]MDZ5471241.1 PLP-dependent aminotransferase family protein [Bacillus sp. 31A1R]
MYDLGLPVHLYLNKYHHKYLAFYHAIKDSIINGTLTDGTRLPSSRELAEQYSISRGTANVVYDMLTADGYVETRLGSGTYVAFKSKLKVEGAADISYQKSSWGQRLKDDHSSYTQATFDFSTLRPLTDLFPQVEWKKAVKQGLEKLNYLVGYVDPDPKGLLELRQGIANYLLTTRGMKMNVEDIIILNGSVNGMALLAHLLIGENDTVLIEEPTYLRVRNMIQTVGGVPVALQIDELPTFTSKLAYVTPSSKYPTGQVMTIEERLKLLQWAKEQNALLIEDDIDSLFNRKTRMLEPLKVLDSENRVIYLGTFAFTLLTPLRIGYAIVPSYLIKDFLKAKHVFEPFTTSLYEQAAIAQFISNGHYGKHVRKMQRVYRQRYETFIKLMDKKLKGVFSWIETDKSLHVFGWWNGTEESYEYFLSACKEKGVVWEHPIAYFMNKPSPCAVFHYGSLTEFEMETAISIMAEVYKHI